MKAKRRMLDTSEIVRNELLLKHLEACRDSGASFTVAAVSSNYVIWKNEKFYPKLLVEYNTLTRKKWDEFEEDKVDDYNQKIYDTCGFMVDVEKHQQPKKKPQGYLGVLRARYNEAEDAVNTEFQKYMICSYLALMEMGYGNKRMNRINDEIVKTFNECLNKERSMSALRKELEDYGVYIEFSLEKNLNFDTAVAAGEYHVEKNNDFDNIHAFGMAMKAERNRRDSNEY